MMTRNHPGRTLVRVVDGIAYAVIEPVPLAAHAASELLADPAAEPPLRLGRLACIATAAVAVIGAAAVLWPA